MTFYRTDGLKPHRKSQFYGSARWRKIARLVGIRDGFTCQKCGAHCPGRRQGVADHKIPRRKSPELAFEMSNLWWLCSDCHNKWKRLEEIHADDEKVGEDGLKDDWK